MVFLFRELFKGFGARFRFWFAPVRGLFQLLVMLLLFTGFLATVVALLNPTEAQSLEPATLVTSTSCSMRPTAGNYCDLPSNQPDFDGTNLEYIDQRCSMFVDAGTTIYGCWRGTMSNDDRGYAQEGVRVYRCTGGQVIDATEDGAFCTPFEESECSIPQGTSQALSVAGQLGSVCYQNCQFQSPSRRICVYSEDGSIRGCRAEYTSTGEYCDDADGASDRPFHDYTDSDGCYLDSGLNRFCATPTGDCPNEMTVDGVRYCSTPSTPDHCNEEGGSSGDWFCSPGDPDYQAPGGDGGDNGGGDGGDDGGGDGDGDGSGDGDGGDGGDSGGGSGGGTGGDGDCDSDYPCSEMPGMPEPKDCTTAEQCVSNAFDRLKTAPLIASIGKLADLIDSGGTCPVMRVDLSMMGWGTISTTVICDISAQLAGTVGSLMSVLWVIIGIRIIASA